MTNYVLVAVGGAVGSVLRYALGMLSITVWGNSFPWGTILINMTGSFLIGLVAAATAAGGFLPASPALRMLVMVGFCGGYTTFSSFSLQTLDLAHDGRFAAALLNVLLSLLVCLAAVTAGYYVVAGPGGRVPAAGASGRAGGQAGQPVMLTVLERPEHVAAQLAAASRLVAAYGGGRIEALAIRAAPGDASKLTEETTDAAMADRLRADERDRVGRLRRIADGWSASAGGATLCWSDPEGAVGPLVRQAGRDASLIVLARPQARGDAAEGRREHDALHAALFETGRPVLMLPPVAVARPERLVVVAWKDGAPIRRAVLSALPLLRAASRVVLLNDEGLREPPSIFGDHGVAVEMEPLQGDGAGVGATLLRMADDVRADLLVMGAFVHAPLREQLLGGVTRHVIETADLPVFLQH